MIPTRTGGWNTLDAMRRFLGAASLWGLVRQRVRFLTLLFLLLSHPRRPLHLVRNHSILIFNCSLSLILPIGILVLSFRLFIDRQPARTTFPLSTHPSSVLPFLCFQSLLPRADAKGTAVKYSKPFVLITIRNAGVWVVGALTEIYSRRRVLTESLLKKKLGSASLVASPLQCALTSHSQLNESTATLSLLESAVTQFRSLTPLEYAVTQKGRGGGSRGSDLQVQRMPRPLSGFSRAGIGFAESPVTSIRPIAPDKTRCHNYQVRFPRTRRHCFWASPGPNDGKHLRLLRCLKKESGQRVRHMLDAAPGRRSIPRWAPLGSPGMQGDPS